MVLAWLVRLVSKLGTGPHTFPGVSQTWTGLAERGTQFDVGHHRFFLASVLFAKTEQGHPPAA